MSDMSSRDGNGDRWKGGTVSFDASRVVPTASENRPHVVELLAVIAY